MMYMWEGFGRLFGISRNCERHSQYAWESCGSNLMGCRYALDDVLYDYEPRSHPFMYGLHQCRCL